MKTPKGTELPMLNLKGKQYLQVAYRLVWFREEKSDWSIETQIVEYDDTFALAKATIKDASGRIIAQAHKLETSEGFGDFVEKSETGAVGRALALCGYGTQFAPDLDEGERIADSPIPKPSNEGAPQCCGKKMMISKYGPDPKPYYCMKCKKTKPRDDMGEIPF